MSLPKVSQSFITLGGAMATAISCGTNYCVSNYLPQVAERLHLTSTQSNLIAASGNLGMYMAPAGIGPIVDRYGATPCLYSAAGCLFFGWLALRSIYVSGELPGGETSGLILLCTAQLVTGLGSTLGAAGSINGVARSFTTEVRGTALATVLACIGSSAFLYSTIYRVFLLPRAKLPPSDPSIPIPTAGDGTASFLLLLAIGCLISMLVGAWLVKPALYDMDHPGPASSAFSSVSGVPRDEASPLLRSEVEDEEVVEIGKPPATGEGEVVNIHGWEMLRTFDFWVLFLIQGLLGGIGLLYINNLGAMIKALNLATPSSVSSPSSQQASLVSYLSLANASGRIFMGAFSDTMITKGVDRIWWSVPVSAGFVAAMLWVLRTEVVAGWYGLTAPTVLVGFSYGNLFGLVPVLCLEWFGLKSYASNNGLLVLSAAIGGQITNYIFGRIYDSHSLIIEHDLVTRSGIGGVSVCKEGKMCYQTALQVTVAMGMLSFVLSIVAGWRRWNMGIRVA